MKKSRTTPQRAKGKAALTVLGVASCIGGAAYAAQAGRSPDSPDDDQAIAAAKSVSLSIRAAPRTRLVARGNVATFTVRIRRGHRAKVKLSVLAGLPRGATASFRRRSTRKKKATLTIRTAGAVPGTYRIRLGARSRGRRATSAVNLVISSSQPTNFLIAGALSRPLAPGHTLPLDLSLTNPGPGEITISSLVVNVDGFSAPRADVSHPCTADDFSVTQFSGTYGFTLGASSTRRLSELGFPAEQWPQLTMLNRPVNQDGCKGVTLILGYGGTSIGGNE